ncbi:SpoIID/LytB domain-containing protein [Williamsia soli]|uniref:SpoIID/LytB domain-containing protein n=1 Tax=Williamsia soli TaxID=364929 RepID=UPI001A9EF627|nr:SpoIID/LytB domain-containing protein [Williamsia soli]
MPRIPGLYTTRPIGGRAAYGARLRRPAAAGVALILAAGAAVWAVPQAVDSDVSLTVGGEVTLIGHGNGHGRGMGQWGAFGYAKQGWTSTQILSHYYGGTTAGKVDNVDVSVILTGETSVNVFADAGLKVGDVVVAPGQAVSLSGSTATITTGCGGGAVQSVEVPRPLVSPITPGPGRPDPELIKMCGTNATFRGSLGLDGGRVINVLPLDDYVKGVLPKEIYLNWADEGGAEALKAQAVAARTYALASIDISKPIDDTQNSQVYGGFGGEDPRSNAAVDATAGIVLNKADGKPAFTEFSSSTGGATDGRDFPAVIDDGDAISPFHDWTAAVSSDSIASTFGVGSLTGFEVIEAYGMGAENGRAAKVRISGTGGTVEVPAQEVRTKLQLRSSFFSVQGQESKPAIVAPPSGVGGNAPAVPVPGVVPGVPPVTPSAPGATGDTLSQLLALAEAAIGGKFSELGGSSGLLGAVLGPVEVTPSGTGAVQQFQNGSVFFSPESGAHALGGLSLLNFALQGGESVLGLPLEDSLSTLAGPLTQIFQSRFENGILEVDPTTGLATRR